MDPPQSLLKMAIQKLAASIKEPRADSDFGNLMCFFEDNMIIWNNDDVSLYVCSLNEQHLISNVRVLALSNPPMFTVSSLCLSPQGDYLALYGRNGLTVAELPLNWTLLQSTACDSNANTTADNNTIAAALMIRSTSIGERMFLCNQHLRLLCFRWHPISRKHIFILNNDNSLQLFDIENEFEPEKTISLASHTSGAELHFERVSIYSSSLGENAISFDIGPALNRFHHIDSVVDSLEIFPIFILRGNGDVLILYNSLKDLSISNRIYGPLKMTPAAEDNYGCDACSILSLATVPPMVVIGTSSGLLYHCIVIESEFQEDKYDQLDAGQELYSFTTSSGIQVIIPECVLYVLESIELSFPLASIGRDAPMYDTSELNASLQLISDIRDPKRYFCLHSFGIHIVMISFCKQLLTSLSEYHEDKSIVEYLICTKPTIEKHSAHQTSDNTFPVGVALFTSRGFTYIAVLLSSAELVCKRLSNIVLPDTVNDLFSLKSIGLDLDSLLISNKNASINTASQSDGQISSQRSTFPEHLEKLLRRNSSLPLIKSSKAKNSTVSVAELEMLLNSIDVLRKEYLEKFIFAAKSIEQRKKVLRNICKVQLGEIDNLNKEKDCILKDYTILLEKYDKIKDAQNSLSARLDTKIAQIQYQRPTLSDAELNLKQELTQEKENIVNYRQKLEQIKRKQRYQESQLRRAMITDDSEKKNGELTFFAQFNSIKDMLRYQGEEISEMVMQVNDAKLK